MTPPAPTGTSGYCIRRGTSEDADACYRIAIAQPRGTLPKLYRVHFADSADKGELHVAECNGAVVGFARFHTRRDGWTTLYDLAVLPDAQRSGIGRNLLYSVPTPLRLKCPASSAANDFYRNAGLKCVGTEGALNVYELRLLTVFCQGGNKDIPVAARQSGMAYGTRSDYGAHDYPFMVDAPFKPQDWDWERHAAVVQTQRPVMALARDYESAEQRADVLRQLDCFRDWGVLRPTVCVKFVEGIADIPPDVTIAVSVPSQYAGWLPPDLRVYAGRRLHLLGGTPQQWLALIPKLQAAGAHVASADGSAHETAAKKGAHWEQGKWRRREGDKADYFGAMVFSGREIVRVLNGGEAFQRQEALW